MAAHSRHPYSLALAAAGLNLSPVALAELREHPGSGLEGRIDEIVYRLGRPEWALAGRTTPGAERDQPDVVLAKEGQLVTGFRFKDELRAGTPDAVAALASKGISVEILSGDREEPVHSRRRGTGS
jgi:Cu2+-exporting ATPase